ESLFPLRYNFFFFKAEDGIRDRNVTGVQTCALPISGIKAGPNGESDNGSGTVASTESNSGPNTVRWTAAALLATAGALVLALSKIGRASCREREVKSADGRYRNKRDTNK